MKRILLILATLCTPASFAFAQRVVSIDYTLTIDAADLSAVAVEMRVRNAPPSFTLAAHAHPEYDDKYWRYLEDMRVEAKHFARTDSVRWEITGAGSEALVRYRVRMPSTQTPRAAWRAFLTPKGGVVGGPHHFLYIVGHEHASANVRVRVPATWDIATGLTRNADGTFAAPNMFALMESPLMVGTLRHWRFDVASTPHDVYYLPGMNPTLFDSIAFVDGIRRIVEQAYAVFRTMPYRRYVFMFSDDAYGGLEHPNSATLGVTSAELAKNPFAIVSEIGHEFFHTWNLMRIKPIEYRGVDYRVQPPTAGLWFSEGLSILYSDLMMRRTGFIMEEPDRIAHLQYILGRYADNPAYDRISAEDVSRAEYNSIPGVFGNLDPSSHQVGEVIGAMLDLIVRDATDGRRDIDDVMRAMDERFANKGFDGHGIETVVAEVCSCDMRPFFDAHVRGGRRIDVNRYLAAIGLRQTVSWAPARLPSGEVERDFRIRANQSTPNDTLRLMLWTTNAIWSRAGLQTNDRVLSVNGVMVKTWPEFRTQIAAVPMGGNVRFELVRDGRPLTINVAMTGYDRASVQIEELPNQTERQRRLRADWLAGK